VLEDLNNSYRGIATRQKIKTTSYYEKYKTAKLAFVVKKEDADCGFGVPIPVAANHLEICKPLDRKSEVYLGVLRRLKSLATQDNLTEPAPSPDKVERDINLTQVLQRAFTQSWLEGQVGSEAAKQINEKFDGGVFDKLTTARKQKLSGVWQGLEKQSMGPDGGPIEYPVFLKLEWNENRAIGEFRFTWKKDDIVLVDETLPVDGSLYDRFLLLNFQDSVNGKLQFGSLFLELDEAGSELRGVDVGVGYKTKKIVTGELALKKVF